MSEAKGPTPPEGGSERRRERRLVFSRRCEVSLVSPIWTLTRKPLKGITENITANGMKIASLKTEPGQAEDWKRGIDHDEEVLAEISFPDLPDFPRLRGQLVWVFQPEEGATAAGENPLVCSVGILFSIMEERETRALRDLIDELARRE